MRRIPTGFSEDSVFVSGSCCWLVVAISIRYINIVELLLLCSLPPSLYITVDQKFAVPPSKIRSQPSKSGSQDKTRHNRTANLRQCVGTCFLRLKFHKTHKL